MLLDHGVVGEIVECKRKEGVLTIKLRFRNTGAEAASFYMIDGRNYDAHRSRPGARSTLCCATARRCHRRRSRAGREHLGDLAPNATWTWWAKYPAPAASGAALGTFGCVSDDPAGRQQNRRVEITIKKAG